MGTSSTKNSDKKKVQIFRLYQDDTIYVVILYIEQQEYLDDIIIIKSSQIIDKKFYIYEKRIDIESLRNLFNKIDNINQAFTKIVNLFENNKVFLENEINKINLFVQTDSFNGIIALEKKKIEDKDLLINELIEKNEILERESLSTNKSLLNEIDQNDKLKVQNNLLTKQNSLLKNQNDQLTNLNKNLMTEIQSNKAAIENLKNEIKRINLLNNELNNQIKSFDNQQKEEDKIPKIIIPYEEDAIVDCIIKLNPIQVKGLSKSLNLIALGMLNGKIIIINLLKMKIHQEIKVQSKVLSLAQLGKFERYLFCSTSDGFILVYLLKEDKYEEIQRLDKSSNNDKTEINKVISLSNLDLASCDRGSIIIWKQKRDQNERRKDEFYMYKEIDIKENLDISQLIEINQNIFACAAYQIKEIIFFQNDEKNYPILHTIGDVESHGYNSNAMAKINDKYFCSGGMDMLFYIICIEPMGIVKKIKLNDIESTTYITCINVSENGFLFVSYGENIQQYKINIDEINNNIELKEIDLIENKKEESKCIATIKNGKLFYQVKAHDLKFYLIPFKQDDSFY